MRVNFREMESRTSTGKVDTRNNSNGAFADISYYPPKSYTALHLPTTLSNHIPAPCANRCPHQKSTYGTGAYPTPQHPKTISAQRTPSFRHMHGATSTIIPAIAYRVKVLKLSAGPAKLPYGWMMYSQPAMNMPSIP